MLEVKTNAKELAKQISGLAKRLEKNVISSVMRTGLDIIGNIAVRDYMKKTAGISEAILTPVDERFVTQRSGRLMRSMLGQRVFSFINVSSFTKSQMELILSNNKAHVPKTDAGGVDESIRNVAYSNGRIIAQFGSKTPYAATHEYGDETRNIKERMYVRPAILAAKKPIMKLFEVAIRGEWDLAGGKSRKQFGKL